MTRTHTLKYYNTIIKNVIEAKVIDIIDKKKFTKVVKHKKKVNVGANVFFYTTNKFKEVEIPIELGNGKKFIQKLTVPDDEPVLKKHNQVTLTYLSYLATFFATPQNFPSSSPPPIQIELFNPSGNPITTLNANVAVTYQNNSIGTVVIVTYIATDFSDNSYTVGSAQLFGGLAFGSYNPMGGTYSISYTPQFVIAEVSGLSISKSSNTPLTIVWEIQIQLSWEDPYVTTWMGGLMGTNTYVPVYTLYYNVILSNNPNTFSCGGQNTPYTSPNSVKAFTYNDGTNSYAVFYILVNISSYISAGQTVSLFGLLNTFLDVLINGSVVLKCGAFKISLPPPGYTAPPTSIILAVFIVVEFSPA